eukprot:m.87139 g.87139  ORF g.87139 m.87139 type:complete len:107 (-) comp12825_c0_seq12:1670-1990(-)
MSIFQALMLAVGVIDSPELTFDCVVIRWKDHSVPTTTTQTSTLFHVYPVPAFWTACIHNRSARLLTFVASVTTTSNLRLVPTFLEVQVTEHVCFVVMSGFQQTLKS